MHLALGFQSKGDQKMEEETWHTNTALMRFFIETF